MAVEPMNVLCMFKHEWPKTSVVERQKYGKYRDDGIMLEEITCLKDLAIDFERRVKDATKQKTEEVYVRGASGIPKRIIKRYDSLVKKYINPKLVGYVTKSGELLK